LLKKFVELTSSQNEELKIAACFAIKNLLFNNIKEIRTAILAELPNQKLIELLDDENIKV